MNTAKVVRAAAAAKPKDVHVTSSNGQVAEATINVSKAAGEQVTWFSYANQSATVTFSTPAGSPFNDSTFQIPAGGSVSSGPVKDSVLGNGKDYKYVVIGQTGINDPVVIIDP